MVSSGDRVLIAVSGGPDSVALLHLLAELKEELGLCLEVAHLQHGIRGEEAREDAWFVREIAERLGLRCHINEVALPKIRAERGKGNLEAMARDARYRFFAEVAKERGIQKVATAHTRDDQAETVLMWMLRGSGRKGLGGIRPVLAPVLAEKGSRSGPVLVRPLIETSREAIIGYLASKQLQYRMDRTNLDPSLLRNWIRLELLPQLREKFDLQLDERLAQLADLMREEEQFLEGLTQSLLPQVVREKKVMRAPLLEQPKAMQRRLIRLWLEESLGNLRGVSFDHVEEILSLIAQGPPQGRLAVPRGREVVRTYDSLCLEERGLGRKAACYSYTLPIQGELVIHEAGMKMENRRSSFIPGSRPEDALEALFDLDSLPETLTVRNFRPGDRFRPLGMQGHRKVKDLFIEKKVPLEVRATLPLLLAGNEILWIPGYGRSEVAKVGAATKKILQVAISPLQLREAP